MLPRTRRVTPSHSITTSSDALLEKQGLHLLLLAGLLSALMRLGRATLAPILLGTTLLNAAQLSSQELRPADRVRIAEARRLAVAVDDQWPGWDQVPFALLLVTEDYEYLLGHPGPTDDFGSLGYDERLGQEILYRERVFQPNLLATFPAVGGVATVVVGLPEQVGLSSTQWVMTALHEHFHQYQMSVPGYFPGVDSLDLSGGDETGMWMLNYPFPYDEEGVAGAVQGMAEAALEALRAIGTDSVDSRVDDYLLERERVRSQLAAPDYRYLSFQMWQEGIARFVQMDLAGWAAINFQPSEDFVALDDFAPFEEVASSLRETLRQELASELSNRRRVFFYALGAAEGHLLDAVRPASWRERYIGEKFFLERYY